MTPIIFAFDVESVGLHGEGFAVGWVIIANGREEKSGFLSCPMDAASGADSDRRWVLENVRPHLPEPTHATPREVRNAFWVAWLAAKAEGAVMLSDCGWPVESRFLAACIDDDPEARRWDGPYPLLDVSSILVAAGKDPLANYGRTEAEMPAHHPTCDARQSARVALSVLAEIDGRRVVGAA